MVLLRFVYRPGDQALPEDERGCAAEATQTTMPTKHQHNNQLDPGNGRQGRRFASMKQTTYEEGRRLELILRRREYGAEEGGDSMHEYEVEPREGG